MQIHLEIAKIIIILQIKILIQKIIKYLNICLT